MSRPKPTVILSHSVPFTGKTEQVLAATAIYAVFYDGRPINVKSTLPNLGIPQTKYRKSSFSNSGHAFNLAERLNTMFATTLFSVVRLTAGEVMVEGDEGDEDGL
jgi:hypothetical protein